VILSIAGMENKILSILGNVLVGAAEGMGAGDLANHPNSHFIQHPQVFMDIEGKREWEAGNLGSKIISLYENPEEEEGTEERTSQTTKGSLPKRLKETYRLLLVFLWAVAKQGGSTVTPREIPEAGAVMSLCDRKAATLATGVPTRSTGPAP
jgi:hypothetical protein